MFGMVQTETHFLILPGLAVGSVRMRIVATGVNLIAQLLAVTLWFGLVAASDRLELGIIAQRIIWLEAVSMRLLVIQTEAHGRILPAFTVGAMLVLLTLVRLFTKAFAVAREMPIG